MPPLDRRDWKNRQPVTALHQSHVGKFLLRLDLGERHRLLELFLELVVLVVQLFLEVQVVLLVLLVPFLLVPFLIVHLQF